MSRARMAWAAIAVAAAVIVVDQVAKAIVRAQIAPGESVTLIEGFLHLVRARNSGIAGGHFADAGAGVIIAISAIALSGLVFVARSLGPRRWLWLPVGLIVGGGLGNLLDRVRVGYVTDFIVFGHGGPANLADQAITVGIVGLLLVAWLSDDPRREEREAGEAGPAEGGGEPAADPV
jgi:signal peptidase II